MEFKDRFQKSNFFRSAEVRAIIERKYPDFSDDHTGTLSQKKTYEWHAERGYVAQGLSIKEGWTRVLKYHGVTLAAVDEERDFQNTQELLASVFGVKRRSRTRTEQEVEDARLISDEAAALGLVRAELVVIKKETLIKPSKGLISDMAEQRYNNICPNCDRPYGIWVAKGSGLPVLLTPTFDHDTPDAAFTTIAEKNENTKNPKNKVICFICNNAKSSYVKREVILTPVLLEDARKLSSVAWTRWTHLTAEQALQRDLAYVYDKHGVTV